MNFIGSLRLQLVHWFFSAWDIQDMACERVNWLKCVCFMVDSWDLRSMSFCAKQTRFQWPACYQCIKQKVFLMPAVNIVRCQSCQPARAFSSLLSRLLFSWGSPNFPLPLAVLGAAATPHYLCEEVSALQEVLLCICEAGPVPWTSGVKRCQTQIINQLSNQPRWPQGHFFIKCLTHSFFPSWK